MKTCKKCLKTKDESEFYSQKSNKDGLKTQCKKCCLFQHTPVTEGVLVCCSCGLEKPWFEFTPHRTNKNGRKSDCKPCASKKYADRRRRLGVVLAPPPGLMKVGWTYHQLPCELCGRSFVPARKTQTRCKTCMKFFRSVWSRLTGSRIGIRRSKASKELVGVVAARLHKATNCNYCKREFSDTLTKELDHFVPQSRGGPTNDANLVVSCRSCNRSKHTLLYREWVDLCGLVAAAAT